MQDIITTIHQLLNASIPVIVTLGVVYFVWGVVQFVIADSDEAKKIGKDRIIYGVIGLAVIVSLWGLVAILMNTFGLGATTAPALPSGGSCSPSFKVFKGLVGYVTCIIGKSIIPLIFALAIAAFVWGVVNFFIIGADEEAKRSQGKQFMIWGIIALAVMLSVWGLVKILGDTFHLNTSIIPKTRE